MSPHSTILTDILQIDACRIRFDGRRSEHMEQALIDRYRCPESFAKFDLIGGLSSESGYFRFGQDTICYGHSASGFRASRADGGLYDVLRDVTTNDSNALLPFDPTDVIDNLRMERYANGFHHGGFEPVEAIAEKCILLPAAADACQCPEACSTNPFEWLAKTFLSALAGGHDGRRLCANTYCCYP